MNNNFTIDSLWPLGIFVGAILCSLLTKWLPRRRIVFTFLTAILSVIGMICGFVVGATLEELLIPFLVLLWLSLHSNENRKEDEK
ncbi:MAG: hypothetical protein K0S04_1455 [Herbinix sp.]|jgi:uncharacterized protein YqgC (DUF456 family)|nr:hypothetical protein [Herbinix sp.]